MSDTTDILKATFAIWWDIFKRTRGWVVESEAREAAWAAWRECGGNVPKAPPGDPV